MALMRFEARLVQRDGWGMRDGARGKGRMEGIEKRDRAGDGQRALANSNKDDSVEPVELCSHGNAARMSLATFRH